MSIIKAEGIVIKGFRYGESSKIVTIFSRDLGKFTALVKSTRSFKSRNSGVFDNLNHISVIFNRKESSDLQFINKGECINPFSQIKTDLEKLSGAFRILELVNHATHDYDTNEELFDLVNNCLTSLNKCERNTGNYLLYFQANLIKLMGIKPDLVEDTSLPGTRKEETFNTANALKLSSKEFPVVNSLFDKGLEFIGNIVLQTGELEKLGNMFDNYLSNHLEKGGFLKTKSVMYELKN